jgi:hypothetical protein
MLADSSSAADGASGKNARFISAVCVEGDMVEGNGVGLLEVCARNGTAIVDTQKSSKHAFSRCKLALRCSCWRLPCWVFRLVQLPSESKIPSMGSAYIVAGNNIGTMPCDKRVLRVTRSSQVVKVVVVLLTSSMTMDSRGMRMLQ